MYGSDSAILYVAVADSDVVSMLLAAYAGSHSSTAVIDASQLSSMPMLCQGGLHTRRIRTNTVSPAVLCYAVLYLHR